jgi:hypothetical protein
MQKYAAGKPAIIRCSQNDSRTCPFRKSYPDVLVVQPGQDWDSDNDTGPLDRPTQRRILAQRQVRARLIVICCIRTENSPQVRLTKDQQSVQALAAHGADKAFRIAILPRRSRRDWSVADTHGPQPGCEDMSVGLVIIAHQISRR